MNNQDNNEVTKAAVTALAAASKTPFRTAFKITLGVGLAHLMLFLAGLTGVGFIIVILLKASQ